MSAHKRIALVGNGTTTKVSADFDGEIWTTASVAKILPRVDRVFEVHQEYDAKRINGYGCPVMMDGKHSDILQCEDLGIGGMVKQFGPMFQFSYDYMAAYAFQHDYMDITTYGIDLATDEEYTRKRLSFYYWVGMLRGKGATVTISQGSAIFGRRWVYCHERDELQEISDRLCKNADVKLEEWQAKQEEARLSLVYSDGYKQCALDILRAGV
jgi:hypothetical protein